MSYLEMVSLFVKKRKKDKSELKVVRVRKPLILGQTQSYYNT